MSQYLRRTAYLVAGALVATGAPFLAAAPATAVPTVPSLGCVVGSGTTAENLSDVAIPDPIMPALPGIPAVSTITVPSGGDLSWLRVRTDVLHGNPGDLVMKLTSPAGSVITLTDRLGGNHPDVFNGTWWADDAGGSIPGAGSVTEALFQNNVLQPLLAPETALSTLRGQDVAGVWTLSVTDQAFGTAGTISGWALQYATRGNTPDTVTMSSGTRPGAPIAPVGGHQTFLYTLPNTGPGALEDLTADLDLSGLGSGVVATLTSPAGTVITLTNGNGGLNSFLGGTTFSDLAGLQLGPITSVLGLLTGHLPLVGSQEPLAGLIGEGTAGVWKLDITNTGILPVTLNDWALHLTSSTCGMDGAVTPLTQVPPTLPLGSTFAYAVSVTNNRLAPLDLSTLELALPSGLDLVSVTSTLGSCAGLTCALGTLLPGAQAVVVYLLEVVTDGVKNIAVTLSSLGLDALPANNVLNVATTVPPGSGTTGKDTTPPGLVMVLGKDKLRTIAKKGVMAVAGWTEGGRLVLTVKLPGKVAKKLGLSRVIGKRSIATAKAGTAKMRVKLSKKAAKKLLKAGKKVRIIVKGQLRDAAGNLGKASASGTFKR